MSWIDVGPVESIPSRGARVLRAAGDDIAVFRTGDGRVFALRDRCPHRGGPLSQGIVHGACVTCPLHDWVIDLATGEATGADEGCTPTFAVRTDRGRVLINVPDASTCIAARPVAAGPLDPG
ncbi:MAG TPA: nitrite reductase small subunit NirD [Gammaproteobacteria bacterium]